MKHERTGEVAAPSFPYASRPRRGQRRPPGASGSPGGSPRPTTATSPPATPTASGATCSASASSSRSTTSAPVTRRPIPELLDYLTDNSSSRAASTSRDLMRMICKSRTYQLSIETNQWNEDDTINFSHAKARRLPAEVLYDSIHAVTGASSRFPGVPAGTRAAALPDVGVELPDGFLGEPRPARPRERLRVRAQQRHAARPGHGPAQRPDRRRRDR